MTTPHDETPETDALVQIIDGGSEYAPLDELLTKARQLERDRNRLRAQLAGVVEQCAKVCDEYARLADKYVAVPSSNALVPIMRAKATTAHMLAADIRAIALAAAPQAGSKKEKYILSAPEQYAIDKALLRSVKIVAPKVEQAELNDRVPIYHVIDGVPCLVTGIRPDGTFMYASPQAPVAQEPVAWESDDPANVYCPHPLQIDSGTFWRCKHGSTGIKNLEFIGCKECKAEATPLYASPQAPDEKERK